jgi:two-component system, cell cycle response regulator
MESDHRLRVLLVEDHPAIARQLQEVLRDCSPLRVTWVASLATALSHLQVAAVDLVLLDLGLPDSQGLDTVARVAQDYPTLPIVVLTAHDEQLAIAALHAGAQDYLQKDAIDAGTLVRAIRYACERKRAEAALREAHEYIAQVVQSVQDGIIVYDRELRHHVWNSAMQALSGVPAALVVGRHAREAPPPWGEATMVATLQRALAGAVIIVPDLAYRKSDDGRNGWLVATFGPLRDAHGAVIGVIGSVRDITPHKEAEELLRSQAMVDDLTGLYNRRGFLALAPQCLRMADRNRQASLLMFADLDGLKAINDTLGHAAGDQALRDVATLLRQTFRTADLLARLGGDEFAVLVADTPFASRNTVLERLAAGLRAQRPLSLSLGVAGYDRTRPCSIEDLLARADAAMYEQKRHKQRTAGRELQPDEDGLSAGTRQTGAR